MNRFVSLAALASALVSTPALAAESDTRFGGMIFIPPMSEISTVVEMPNIDFDLAKVGKTDSTLDNDRDPAAVPTPTEEEEADKEPLITGGMSLDSANIYSDLYRQNDSPTVKVFASVDVGLPCTGEGYASRAVDTSFALEVDVGFECPIKLGKKVNATVSYSHYFLNKLSDIDTFQLKLSAGRVDASITQYVVQNGEADATKIEVGYTLSPVKALSLRLLGVYENGFHLPDLLAAGVEASYALTKRLSLTGAVYTPLRGAGPRTTQAVAGISFNF